LAAFISCKIDKIIGFKNGFFYQSLAMLFISISLMIMIGWDSSLLKLLLIIVFLWFANPISGHLMARLEVITNPQIGKEYEVVRLERD